MLPRMAEYGGGSPCGGVFYGEDAWPEKYRGRLFWAEWGKRAVQAFRFVPDGATFKVADVIDFVEPGDVESFRPLDLALSPRRPDALRRRLVDGRLEQQDREARAGSTR